MDELRNFKTPLLISGAVHLVFALFLLVDWGFEDKPVKQVVAPHVKASLVTDDPFKHQKDKALAEKRKKWEAERKRKAELERKRVAAEKRKVADEKRRKEAEKKRIADKKRQEEAKKKAAQEKKKQEALALKKKEAARKKKEDEKKRLAEEKKKAEALKAKQEAERLAKEELARQEEALAKQEAEQKKKEQEEKERKELEALEKELAALQEQAEARKVAKEKREAATTLILQIAAIVKESVLENWNLPKGYDSSWSVELRLHFQPDGDIKNVDVVQTSGNVGFDRSAIQAIWRMGAIPEVRDLDEEGFNAVKSIRMRFKPEE